MLRLNKSFIRRFEFNGSDGTRITISLRGVGPSLTEGDPLQLVGPHGSALDLKYVGPPLSSEQKAAVVKLLASDDLGALNDEERESIADAKLVLANAGPMASYGGPCRLSRS